MKKTIITLAAALLCAVTAIAKDIKTLTLTTTPQMHCEGCENKIKNALRFEKGVKSIDTDIPTQTVTVSYDADKTTESHLTEALAKAGYKATRKPATKPTGKPTKKAKKHRSSGTDGNTGASPQAR